MRKILLITIMAFIFLEGFGQCFSKISAGGIHTLAIKTDGTLWAWGYNVEGQLGDGTNTSKNSPVQIGTATNWVMISAGFFYSLAIKTDGSLWAWGENNYGQLGDGSNTDRNTPVQIGTATNWASISAGEFHNIATQTNGSLLAWGFNNDGQLGNGTFINAYSPLQIGSATNWASISAGSGHTIATKTDGSLWAWGENNYGQLGDGTNTSKNSPVQIGTATNWASTRVGVIHTIATQTNGSLWAWGTNSDGELGDGTTTNKSSPTSITCPSTLPLKPLSFNAKYQTPNSLVLNWQTANEVNFSHFIIQRGNNGKNFENIGKVNASCCSYEFQDSPPLEGLGVVYYRLEMVDKDGSKTYSEIKRVTLNEKQETRNIILYPNPAKDIVTIECSGAKELLIIDNLGRIIKQFNNPTKHQTINAKQMAKGIFIVKAMMNNGDIKTEKLVIE